MGCVWAVLVAQPWAWWGVALMVLGLAVVVVFGAGYVTGADRWSGRQGIR